MKQRALSLLTAAILVIISYAAYCSPAYPFPLLFTQPDGTHLKITLKGDEFSKWAETSDGYALLFNSKGYYEYAKKDSRGFLIPSGIVAKANELRSAEDNSFLAITEKHLTYSKEQHSMFRTAASIRNSEALRAFPTTGDRKLICILIGFTDVTFQKTHEDFDNLFNQIGYSSNGATGSVKDFYSENSYGQLNLSITVAGPYTASHEMAYYGGNNSSNSDSNPKELVTEAVTLADADVNFADFDNDLNGSVDGVYVIYAGYGEEASASADAIWAHAWSIPALTLDGTSVSRYSCSAELRGNSGTDITAIGVISHEFGHVLGAPDYYDTDYASSGGNYTGTGNWDIMAGGSWNNGGLTPANHNAYTKTYVYNWLPVTTLSTPQDVEVFPTNSTQANIFRIDTKTAGEYYLLENRQNIGFDLKLPGHGLMIYHIHKDFNSLLAGNDLNNGFPQMMYPVCASSTITPNATPSSFGNINSGGCSFPGTSNKTEFTDATMPSAKSWDDLLTGIPVTQITETATNTVTFSLKETADFYTSKDSIAINESVTVSDNSFGNSISYQWNFGEGATPQTSTEQGPIPVTYATPGTKTITLTINGSTTKQIIIVVYDPATISHDVIVYNFNDQNKTADGGATENLTKVLSANIGGSVTYTVGSGGGYILNGTGWDLGAGTKSWETTVDATNYNTLTVSSSQSSNSNGPKNFKIQYRVGAGSWIDVPTASAVLTTSIKQQLYKLPLPQACNNQAQLGIRWIMTDNISIGGNEVTSDGISKIDNINIQGLMGQLNGIESDLNNLQVNIFPNPFSGYLSLKSSTPLKLITIYDVTGKLLMHQEVSNGGVQTINTESLSSGYYFVRVVDSNGNASTIKTVKQ